MHLFFQKIKEEISRVIVGYDEVIEYFTIGLLSDGHIFLVGVPGLAKTLLVKSFGKVFDLKFSRVQFTPDLMPSDIIGTEILEEKEREKTFRFYKGPIFTNLLLADEINRAPPRTQSALLEAMQEKSVTVAGKTYKLEEPFMVIATQNPIEHEGTYPLPEAQLDRFMFQIIIDYPDKNSEIKIADLYAEDMLKKIKKVVSKEEILRLREEVKKVPVPENIKELVVELIRHTRPQNNSRLKIVKDYVRWGCSPRASQYLIRAIKARAFLNNRPLPNSEDVFKLFPLVVRHRIILNFQAEADNVKVDDVINEILKNI
ncbi:AAA family ATPase [Candidatus Pacearchaeota archaeon]|nr:MAG: AAA family ATPase [Candidatus Pacearchaeota archaeon]